MPKLHTLALPIALVIASAALPVGAQTNPDLLISPRRPAGAAGADGRARRLQKAQVDVRALDSATIRLRLFDDLALTVKRARSHRPASDKLVWVGEGENGAQAVLTVVEGVLSGTVFADNRSFEISLDADGLYSVIELDPAAFPTDDPIVPGAAGAALEVPAGPLDDAPVVASAQGSPVQIDAMIVWTSQAEAAAGGRVAMESLALGSVENANLIYANSGVNAQLRLVYAARVNSPETPGDISGDLGALRAAGDGRFDEVHSLRTQYGADVVTLLGEGYRGAGSCGIGYVMTSVGAAFASYAFNVVDRTCAGANLSYAHEVGHNQGLNHDPANAGNVTPAFPYAYGYQSPSGYFRTVMAYGGATRIPYFSSSTLQYSGLPIGNSGQDNARALSATVSTVAAFKPATVGSTPPPCSYSVSMTSMAFGAGGGSQSVSITAPAGCAWSVNNDAGADWIGFSASGGSGSGAVTVTAAANTGSARSTTVTIAGTTVIVSEAAGVSSIPVPSDPRNVAAASAGATATASTIYGEGYSAAGAINGDRAGRNWGAGGGWNDATAGGFPDWLQVDFAGPKTISEIRVFSVQDNFTAPVEPTPTQTFSLYGLTSFTVQYWDGGQWLTVPGGTVTGSQQVWRSVSFPAVTTTRIRVIVNAAVDWYSRIAEVEAMESPVATSGTNVAAASAGATAWASTTYDAGFSAAGAINGDRQGRNWGGGGGWNDATAGSFPDWLQVEFAGAKTINEVRIFSVQDNYTAPVEPTPTQTFSRYGLTSFTVYYWEGAQWRPVPGGAVSGNQNVWRSVTFPAVTTARILVVVDGAVDSYSRIAEVEAIEAAASTSGVNVAAASAGATASASTIYDSGYSAAGAINGDRAGRNWGSNGGWNDATGGGFPDWLQVDFAGPKSINEIRVFSVQDNFLAPVEPAPTQTFSLYGLTYFTVQYWDGGQWLTVPGGTVTGNQHVWRTVSFPPVTTSRVRVVVNGASDWYSRIAEVEAYGIGTP